MILFSGSLQRKYSNGSISDSVHDWPYPTLTMSGTLDGLYRFSRQAETYVKQIEGASHWSFAGGVDAPFFVRHNDLKPDMPYQQAWQIAGQTVATWIRIQMGSTSSADIGFMQKALDNAHTLLAPMIKGLRLEGFTHLYKACNSDCPCPDCEFYPKYPSKVDCTDVQ